MDARPSDVGAGLINLQDLCRICGTEKNRLITLYDDEDPAEEVIGQVNTYLSLTVSRLPSETPLQTYRIPNEFYRFFHTNRLRGTMFCRGKFARCVWTRYHLSMNCLSCARALGPNS